MIAVLVTWIVIIYVFYIFGKTISYIYSSAQLDSYTVVDTIFIGLCATGALISINSLFRPSGLNTAITLIISSLILNIFLVKKKAVSFAALKKKANQLSINQHILVSLIGCCFILFAMVPPQLADTFYYHIQNIMWNDEYTVVPGLANLHDRFGFNSNIFLFYSTFGFKAIFGQYIFAFNTLFFTLIIIDILINALNKKVLFILSCIIVFLLYFSFQLHIGAPSSDLLVNLLIIYLMLQLLRDETSITKKPLVFYLLPIFCITLKLSASSIVILSLIVLIHLFKSKSYKKIFLLLGFALCIVLPWLCRNVIISGYILYPFVCIDFFSFDWKLPEQYAIESEKYIKAYAISTDSFKSSDLVLNYSVLTKLAKWIAGQSLLNLSICIAAIISICYFIPFTIKNRVYKNDSAIFTLWIVALVGIIMWTFTAPDIRFVIGFMTILIVIPLYQLSEYIFPSIKNIITRRDTLIIGSVFTFVILILSVRYYKATKDWREPIAKIFYTPDTVNIFYEIHEVIIDKQITINNLTLYLPVGGCLDCPLPCSRDYIKNIEMRGSSLQDGFREKRIK